LDIIPDDEWIETMELIVLEDDLPLKYRERGEDEEEEFSSSVTKFAGSKLLKPAWSKLLSKWTDYKKGWKMIYKGSKDGFQANKFRNMCSGQGPTVTVIKSTNGNIFGGYNANNWASTGSYVYNGKCFLFSFINETKQPVQITNTGPHHSNAYSTYDGSNYGPTFGGGHDLVKFYLILVFM
jgi:hypothetical protein